MQIFSAYNFLFSILIIARQRPARQLSNVLVFLGLGDVRDGQREQEPGVFRSLECSSWIEFTLFMGMEWNGLAWNEELHEAGFEVIRTSQAKR